MDNFNKSAIEFDLIGINSSSTFQRWIFVNSERQILFTIKIKCELIQTHNLFFGDVFIIPVPVCMTPWLFIYFTRSGRSGAWILMRCMIPGVLNLCARIGRSGTWIMMRCMIPGILILWTWSERSRTWILMGCITPGIMILCIRLSGTWTASVGRTVGFLILSTRRGRFRTWTASVGRTVGL